MWDLLGVDGGKRKEGLEGDETVDGSDGIGLNDFPMVINR